MSNQGDVMIIVDNDPMMEKIIAQATQSKTVLFDNLKNLVNQVDQLNPQALFVDTPLAMQENSLETLPFLKSKWPFCPIIMLVGETGEKFVGEALANGADDFIYKPINSKEVSARLHARLGELSKKEAQEVLKIGDVTIDTSHRVVTNRQNQTRYLSPTEMNLLTCLIEADGAVVRRETMKKKCWGQIYVSDNALNRKLHEVRRALKEISSVVTIRTIYGTGFALEVKSDARLQKGA